MNAVELVFEKIREMPFQVALQFSSGESTTFAELGGLAFRTQHILSRIGVRPGDAVLLFETLNPLLFAGIIGMAGMGVATLVVEPWMPVNRINHVLSCVKPKAFLANPLGMLWGSRVPSIRQIPHWLRTRRILSESSRPREILSLSGDDPAIITFTSGTAGNPKGMARTHRCLIDQQRILTNALHLDTNAGPDLCIFANFALSNLAAGRTSLIVSPSWKRSHLLSLDSLPPSLRPVSLTCGPAFLLRLMDNARLSSLKSIHVGGALVDCAIFESAFAKWPDTRFTHLYGSTEVEPVSAIDAGEAVLESRRRGFFQTLCLGRPVPEIKARFEPDTVWVTGPHVCPRYLANEEEDRKYKQHDAEGRTWHRMGDRIRVTDEKWWFMGRENQSEHEFREEQRLYALIRSSAAFIDSTSGKRRVFCQQASYRRELILSHFPDVEEVINVTIRRDRRHRSRIDRKLSMGKKWLGFH